LFYSFKTKNNSTLYTDKFQNSDCYPEDGKRKGTGSVELIPKCIKIHFLPYTDCFVLVLARLMG